MPGGVGASAFQRRQWCFLPSEEPTLFGLQGLEVKRESPLTTCERSAVWLSSSADCGGGRDQDVAATSVVAPTP
jgi:hypothetical protein